MAFSAAHERPSYKEQALKKHPGATCRKVYHELFPNGHAFYVTLTDGREYGEGAAWQAWERALYAPPAQQEPEQ